MRKMIEQLLAKCKAVPFSKPKEGGHFYKVMSQMFKLPNGEIITREFIAKKPAAAVVPITIEGNIVCVIQPASLTDEGSLIEIPAGYAEDNEISASAAVRELVEETGYVPTGLKYLGKHYQDPGGIKGIVNVFVAFGCVKKHGQKLDRDEFVETIEVSKDEIKELMADNMILDGNSFIALSKARLLNFI